MKFGLERIDEIKKVLKGKKVAVVCNISSVDSKLNSVIQVLRSAKIELKAVFGPQHGFIMDKQDNMKESSDANNSEFGCPIYSLYGEHRVPQNYMLKDTDAVVFDLQDVGARYYTFIYTMANTMKACKQNNIEFVVLDRPNPLNGVNVEGGIVHKGFESFVGMYPISHRHGMTVGELALMFNDAFGIGCKLKIIKVAGWKRSQYWNREWIIPSPNMPTFDTALVYVGQCLLEATNISEGRGTTRPFELFGAPFIEHKKMLEHKAISSLKGVFFRPVFFEPTFNKFKGEVCKGFQIHVTDKKKFDSLKTGLAVIYSLYNLYPQQFSFTPPPYEYEYEKMPIDILLGTDKARIALDNGASFKEFCDIVDDGKQNFIKFRKQYLIYK